MADLPHELINEIFLWLPVKSLLRFKCVSKSFCALIGSQSFINSHFQRSSRNNKLIDLGQHQTDDFQQESVLNKLCQPDSLYPLFFSYCNGLVLLCLLPCELSIWNPSTRKYRILPALHVKKNTHERSFALGYDSTANDYKVLVIVSEKGWETSQVWIFELRSSCWRRIQDFPYTDCNIILNMVAMEIILKMDGALHFLCYYGNANDASHIIAPFDVAKETFSVLDEPIYQPRLVATRLHAYGGCLYVSLHSMTTRDHVDMYVRKKDGVAFSWTRLYSVKEQQFDEDEDFGRFILGRVVYSKEGNKVFLSTNGKLCSYDFKEKNLQELVTTNGYSLDVFSYCESLASVG